MQFLKSNVDINNVKFKGIINNIRFNWINDVLIILKIINDINDIRNNIDNNNEKCTS